MLPINRVTNNFLKTIKEEHKWRVIKLSYNRDTILLGKVISAQKQHKLNPKQRNWRTEITRCGRWSRLLLKIQIIEEAEILTTDQKKQRNSYEIKDGLDWMGSRPIGPNMRHAEILFYFIFFDTHLPMEDLPN